MSNKSYIAVVTNNHKLFEIFKAVNKGDFFRVSRDEHCRGYYEVVGVIHLNPNDDLSSPQRENMFEAMQLLRLHYNIRFEINIYI